MLIFMIVLTSFIGKNCIEARIPLNKPESESFDFIIVGAGSAGSVVANRLSEVGNVKVLLLEAGGNETLDSEVPLFAPSLQLTPLDWNFTTTKQKNSCLASVNNQCAWPQGHVLGGSSVLNYMIYVRGNKKDFDDWAALGNTHWDYNSVLPYFKKQENYTGYGSVADLAYRGTKGPLTVGFPPYHTALADAFIKAGEENKYKVNDYNGKTQTGVQLVQATIRNGQRCSTNKAYLWPIVGQRKNLVLKTNAFVLKILLDATNKAYGVIYSIDNVPYTAKATKEVIVSAGALKSPQLLMLSGIGEKNQLQKFGIPVKVESNGVGKNFQDHVACGGLEWIIKKQLSLVVSRVVNNQTQQQWQQSGTGPLTVPAQVEATAFVHTDKSKVNLDFPDIQLFYLSGSPASDGGTVSKAIMGFKSETWDQYYDPVLWNDTYSIYPVLLRPKSRGTLSLQSSNPRDPPAINPAFFTDEGNEDIKTLVKGIRIALQFGDSNAFSKFGSSFRNTTFPGCENVQFYSDAYWECLSRNYIAVNFHPTSTCSMGDRKKQPLAVVDQRLRVYGVDKLRVIDASIMPLIISGNTNGPTVMIGEKGSDMIKEDWRL
ncbi:hypothetical protein CHUAL_001140 [Chamberlinius hualienensis]